uniref:Uncharacterized protein n=1 Tax=Entomoneis paludosa TaxID=265537 RepID=A0A7S2Y219_9STRA
MIHDQLLNLENYKITLERAEGTYQIQQAMRQTATTLQQIRVAQEQQVVEEGEATTEQTMETIAQEMEHAQANHAALTPALVGDGMDDESLLQELESYQKEAEEADKKEKKEKAKLPPQQPTKVQGGDEEDNVDVDELLSELELLSVGTTPPAATSPTLAASVFGESTATSQRGLGRSASSKKKSHAKPTKKAEKKPEKPRLAAVCL